MKLDTDRSTFKVCVVGSTGHQHVTCISWEDIATVNLVDFDFVILSVRTYPQKYRHYSGSSRGIREQLARLIASGGCLIVLGDKVQKLDLKDGWTHTNYSWSPIVITTQNESGDTVQLSKAANDFFPKLLSRLTRWNFYYNVSKEGRPDELLIACEGTGDNVLKILPADLAVNRYGKTLAGIFTVNRYNRHISTLQQAGLGSAILLPHIEELEDRQAINLVLEDLLQRPQESLPPSWVENVPMPLTGDIQRVIDDKRTAIQDLEEEIAEREKEKRSIEIFKKLLYADGKELEEIFSACLQKLGGKVTPAKYSQEEFVLEYKNGLYLVECKGVGKSIALTHVRQLLDYILKFEEDEGKAGKGILLGNPWKDRPAEERGTESTPIFPDNVIDRAEMNRISLVYSVDFFLAFCRFLDGKIPADMILDSIINTSGVVNFPIWQNVE